MLPNGTPPTSPDPEALFLQRLQELQSIIGTADADPFGATNPAAPAPPGLTPMDPGMDPGMAPMAGPGDASSPGPMDGLVPPDVVKAATGAMVQAGRLPTITDTLTPEVVNILSEAVESSAPGLYDLNNPDDMREAIYAAGNGTLPIPPARGSQPHVGGPGLPGGGPLPGGLPGPSLPPGAGPLG